MSKRKAETGNGEVQDSNKRLKAENQTVYINNLNDKINPSILKHNLYLLCSGYGDVIDIITKPKSKRMRGQAHVIFGSLSEAHSAVQNLDQFDFFNKPLRVQFATRKSTLIKRVELMD